MFVCVRVYVFMFVGEESSEHQDEVHLVGLRHVVLVDASAIALQPILEDVDEDAARMFLESKLKRLDRRRTTHQLIGLREKLQENPIFHWKIDGFL